MDGRKQNFRWVALGLAIGLLSFAGCGKSMDSAAESSQDAVPVAGVGGFGTQCALTATRGDPIPVRLTSSNCGTTDQKLELSAPLLPLILQANCEKREVLAYSVDGQRVESRWDALPDGRFYFTMYAGNASFSTGPDGQGACQSPLSIQVAGLMNCNDRDHAEIQVDATWILNTVPPGTEPHLTGPQCAASPGCTMHSFVDLHQCS